jgi:hypothetical protein
VNSNTVSIAKLLAYLAPELYTKPLPRSIRDSFSNKRDSLDVSNIATLLRRRRADAAACLQGNSQNSEAAAVGLKELQDALDNPSNRPNALLRKDIAATFTQSKEFRSPLPAIGLQPRRVDFNRIAVGAIRTSQQKCSSKGAPCDPLQQQQPQSQLAFGNFSTPPMVPYASNLSAPRPPTADRRSSMSRGARIREAISKSKQASPLTMKRTIPAQGCVTFAGCPPQASPPLAVMGSHPRLQPPTY